MSRRATNRKSGKERFFISGDSSNSCLFLYSHAANSVCWDTHPCSKYNSNYHSMGCTPSPIQDGIVLKLNILNNGMHHKMMITPSPEDVLDAGTPPTHEPRRKSSAKDDESFHKSTNMFCCDPISASKQRPRDRKSSRRRRCPGQAVQVLDSGDAQPASDEVRHHQPHHHHGSIKEPNRSSAKSFASTSHNDLAIICSAPQLTNNNNSRTPSLVVTPIICTQSPSPVASAKSSPNILASATESTSSAKYSMKRHSSLRQSPVHRRHSDMHCISSTDAEALVANGGDSTARNYDDMIKFVFTEHGIKVISDKEYVV